MEKSSHNRADERGRLNLGSVLKAAPLSKRVKYVSESDTLSAPCPAGWLKYTRRAKPRHSPLSSNEPAGRTSHDTRTYLTSQLLPLSLKNKYTTIHKTKSYKCVSS